MASLERKKEWLEDIMRRFQQEQEERAAEAEAEERDRRRRRREEDRRTREQPSVPMPNGGRRERSTSGGRSAERRPTNRP